MVRAHVSRETMGRSRMQNRHARHESQIVTRALRESGSCGVVRVCACPLWRGPHPSQANPSQTDVSRETFVSHRFLVAVIPIPRTAVISDASWRISRRWLSSIAGHPRDRELKPRPSVGARTPPFKARRPTNLRDPHGPAACGPASIWLRRNLLSLPAFSPRAAGSRSPAPTCGAP
jgi:hypothetical protein